MRLLSTLGLSGVMQAMTPGFEAAHGIRIEAEFLPTAVLMPRLLAGETADAVLLTADGVAELEGRDRVQPHSRRDLARSFVGVAVRAGAPQPDISTRDAFVAALLAARSVAMSRQGASGLFMAALLPRLGIADAVLAKATIIATGYTAELAADGTVELALQQVSELMVVPGVDVVGRLPPGLGAETVFSGAVLKGAANPAPAAALLAAIAAAHDLLLAKGLEPVTP